MRDHEAATGKEIMSDSVVGGVAGAGLGGLVAFGAADASIRGARRSRNSAVRAFGRAKGFRQAAAGLAGMAGAGVGGMAGSMAMGGHTWFQGVPKEAMLKMASDFMSAIMKGKPAAFGNYPKAHDAVDVVGKLKGSVSMVKKPAGKLIRLPGAAKTAGVIPAFDVLPTKGGALARSVKPSTIAKNVKSMHAMPAKIAGALSTVIREADVLIPGMASMGKKPKEKPMPKFAFEKKAREQKDGDMVQREHMSVGKATGKGALIGAGIGAGMYGALGAAMGKASGKGVAKYMAGGAAYGAVSGGGAGLTHGFAYGKGRKHGRQEKKAEESMPKFAFQKKMPSMGGDKSGKPQKKGFAFKKKADGEKTAGIATEGSLESERGTMSSAMAAFLGIPSDDIRMAEDHSPADAGRR